MISPRGTILNKNCIARIFSTGLTVIILVAIVAADAPKVSSSTPSYRLNLFNVHTGQRLDIVYRHGDAYERDALARLDDYLKDRRTGDVHHYDPQVFDLLHDLETTLGRSGSQIDILCGYRSPWTNDFLRKHSDGVALHSLHMLAKAIDIRIPGIRTTQLRDAALSLHRGGVGYYAKSGFVHVDVGRIRNWRQ